MEVYRSVEDVPSPGKIDVTLTMGSFDGVHIGHRRILDRVSDYGDPGEQIAGLVTFAPHPLTVLAPQQAPDLLSPLNEKMWLLSEFRLSYALVMKFDARLAAMEAGDFVRDIIVEKLCASKLIVGYDTHFGRGGKGDVKFLESAAGKHGFDLEVVEPVKYKRKLVSSTAVRKALQEGDVELANGMLGRPYAISGEVEKGMGLGAKLGIPTANITLEPNKQLPRFGVYSVYANVGGKRMPAVANIGVKPTVKRKDPAPVYEVHIIDYEEDLYGKILETEIVGFQRPERRYSGAKELVAQIRKDIDIAAKSLK